MTRNAFKFAALAYALSWAAWLPLTLHALGWTASAPWPYWHLVGGCGPAVAALVMATRDGRGRMLVASCVHAPARWVVIALLGPVALYVIAAAVLHLFGVAVDLSATARSTEYPYLGVAPYIAANLICYGFGEEIGWRGYLLPALQRRHSAVRASLVVAAVWAGWHLPLFTFATGMAAMGAFGVVGWLASLVAGSFLMTALYNRSGSVLPVALFHGALDVLINSPTGDALPSIMGALVTVLGFVVPFHLRGRQPRADAPR